MLFWRRPKEIKTRFDYSLRIVRHPGMRKGIGGLFGGLEGVKSLIVGEVKFVGVRDYQGKKIIICVGRTGHGSLAKKLVKVGVKPEIVKVWSESSGITLESEQLKRVKPEIVKVWSERVQPEKGDWYAFSGSFEKPDIRGEFAGVEQFGMSYIDWDAVQETIHALYGKKAGSLVVKEQSNFGI